MDTDSFIVYITTEDVDIAKDIETRFDTSNYELDRSLPQGLITKKFELTKDEDGWGGKTMTKLATLRPTTCSRRLY